MAEPSTTGIGQGAAQVFDTSNLANIYGQKKMAEDAAKLQAKKDLEKKIAELSGAAEGIFKEKYFATRDDGYIRGLYNDLQGKYAGQWEKVADMNSPEYREYKNDIQNMFFEAKKSEESKTMAQPFMADIGKKGKFRPESIQYFNKFMDTPGMSFDPSQMKEVNDFDIEKNFNELLPQYRKTVQEQGSTSFYGKNNDVFGNYDKTKSTEEMEENQMKTFLLDLQTNLDATEKVEEMYGEEARQLQEQGQDVTVWDLVYRDYKPRLKVDVTKSTFSQVRGAGKEEPFNPNNIVEDTELNMSNEKDILNMYDKFPNLKNILVANTVFKPSKMYQTKTVKATVPITKDFIRMSTGKPTENVGTYPVEMSSPMVIDGKLMVPAFVSKGTKGGNVSVLIPAEEVQEQFAQAGYDMKQIADGLGVKDFGGNTTESSRDRMLKLKGAK